MLETSLVFQPLPVQITKYIANKPYHNNCQPFPTSKLDISVEVQVAPHEPPSHWSCHGPDEGGWLRKHKHNKQWKKVNTWDDMNIYCEYKFNKNGEWRMQIENLSISGISVHNSIIIALKVKPQAAAKATNWIPGRKNLSVSNPAMKFFCSLLSLF